MGVQVTIRPHVVFDKLRGRDVEFDQFQILIGQRVCGYLGKDQKCQPKLVAANLPEDCLAAINDACDEMLKRGKYAAAGDANAASVPASIVKPIGSDPKKEKPAPLPAPDAAASAALEEAIEASNPPKKNAA